MVRVDELDHHAVGANLERKSPYVICPKMWDLYSPPPPKKVLIITARQDYEGIQKKLQNKRHFYELACFPDLQSSLNEDTASLLASALPIFPSETCRLVWKTKYGSMRTSVRGRRESIWQRRVEPERTDMSMPTTGQAGERGEKKKRFAY